MKPGALGPALVISLDFELHWGMTERVHDPEHPYTARLRGAREAVPRLLELFERRDIHATWATVGMLFAHGADDLEVFKPTMRPAYENGALDTYRVQTGDSEQADPLHFAPSLIRQIEHTPGQEVACHTFSHYYCDEPAQGPEAFRADLVEAKAIAARSGTDLRSLVFPRNQVLPDYLPVVQELGFKSYRGNPSSPVYQHCANGFRRQLMRAIKLADSFINLTGHHTVPWPQIFAENLGNVRASRFLRPYSRKLRVLDPLRGRRVKADLKFAARRGELYHLWWHPHNFGVHLEENLTGLESILDEFERLRERYGMKSLTMDEAADIATQTVDDE